MIKNLPLLFLFLLLNLQVKANEPEEMRAVWLTTNYQLDWPSETGVSDRVIMRQKAELVKMLNQLQHVGLNTIFFQARLKGTVFYHSAIEGQSKYQTGKAGVRSSFDALAFVVEECHKRGMKCHAWMVCMPLGGKKYIQQNGLDAFVRKNSSFITLHQGEYYLEPSAVQTADYLASIAEEMVRNYNIDGVHLDYIRYPENAALYPDRKRYDKSGKKESFAQWRRDNITNIVYTIYDRIKAVRSDIELSSAPLGLYNGRFGQRYYGWNAYDAGYQEVEKWLREDKHDFIAPMMYYKGPMFYPFVADWCLRSHGKRIVPGLGIYRLNEPATDWTLNEIEKQIWWSRRLGASGYVLFRAKNLLNDHPSLYWRMQYLNE